MNKIAFISGCTGQDGSYLSDFLLEKNYEVHGLIRRSSTFNGRERIEHLENNSNFYLHYGDMLDMGSLMNIIKTIQPDEIYNLAAQSHVGLSFEMPDYTKQVNTTGVENILRSIQLVSVNSPRFYQAGTSEMFGLVQEVPQRETTDFYPRSPYGISKLHAHWTTKNYREAYGMFNCNGILFNHESPRRGENFVTRKITKSIANILTGKQDHIELGNIYAKRDWGHVKDYVYGMWLMLQQDEPDDYVLATGEQHSVKELLELCFSHVGINLCWAEDHDTMFGFNGDTGKNLVYISNKKYMRASEVDSLVGCADKAKEKLGWKPSYTFNALIYEMMEHDLKEVGIDIGKLDKVGT